MKGNVTEIILQYGRGETTLEETNKALAEAGSVRINPDKGVITEAERAATVVDTEKGIYDGWALLSTGGIGSLEKIRVNHGKTDFNYGVDCCNTVYMGGHKFSIPDGETLQLAD